MNAHPIHIDSEIRNDATVLKVSGCPATRPGAAPLGARIRQLAHNGTPRVVVDLSGTKWCGAAFLGELVAGLRLLRSTGRDLELTGLTRKMDRILNITRLSELFRPEKTTAVCEHP